MKIWEIDLTKVGSVFEDSNDNDWVVENDMNLYCENMSNTKIPIKDWYSLHEMLTVDFTEVIDWSKVAVDTPVWCRSSMEDSWEDRHFKCVENNRYACFEHGRTSHTVKNKTTCGTHWGYCSLTDPDKGE